MKDDLRTFKDTVNSNLSDIHVTDELKNKTFRECKSNKKVKPAYVTAAITVFMIFTTASYNHFFPNKTNRMYGLNMITTEEKLHNIENMIKDSIISPIQNNNNLNNKSNKNNYAYNKNKSSKLNENNKDSKNTTVNIQNTANEQIDKTISKDKSTSAEEPTEESATVNKEIPKDSSDEKSYSAVNKISSENESNSNSSKPDVSLAEDYLGEKLNMPSYLPDDLKLNNINISKSDDKSVNINYDSKGSHLNINQGKNSTKDNEGEKIDINGVEARSCWVESKSELRITWNKDNTKYTIQGNVPKSTLIDVAKSMK